MPERDFFVRRRERTKQKFANICYELLFIPLSFSSVFFLPSFFSLNLSGFILLIVFLLLPFSAASFLCFLSFPKTGYAA
jgi:hypothetical protein